MTLAAWADNLQDQEAKILSQLEIYETRATARVEFEKTLRALRTYSFEQLLLKDREPLGTVCVALPFNNPLYSLVLYACGPLLAGNHVRCRPSSLTKRALQGIEKTFPEEFERLGFTVDHSGGLEFIEAAAREADCLIFTGSWKNVQSISSTYGRKLIYCGPGLNPFIVLRDAKIDVTVEAALEERLFNSGQDCLAAERFYVHDSKIDEFVAGVASAVDNISVGYDPTCDVGPLVSEAAATHLQRLMTTEWHSRRTVRAGSVTGQLVTPSVYATTLDDPLLASEKYGPIFVIASYSDERELGRILNSSDFLLGVTVYGDSGFEELGLEYPHIAHNESLLKVEGVDAHVPFGGRRKSGFVKMGADLIKDGPILFSIETSRSTKND
ncbi:aldehyde dehydrogenase family protein [Streptomyces sp. NPDC057403]|uniref:aldehyde dehydrogenase family protein n=1 Tax=Streptomyces sp. NPDC057403 TaxID=3346119 RepID=UPI0036AC65D4